LGAAFLHGLLWGDMLEASPIAADHNILKILKTTNQLSQLDLLVLFMRARSSTTTTTITPPPPASRSIAPNHHQHGQHPTPRPHVSSVRCRLSPLLESIIKAISLTPLILLYSRISGQSPSQRTDESLLEAAPPQWKTASSVYF
jgi:hypothetical protein